MLNLLRIGIDAVDVKRVREVRLFERVSEYILHAEEREAMRSSRDQVQFLASRFAIKEAVIKACPVTLSLMDVQVIGYGAKLIVQLSHPQAYNYYIDVGLTHTPELAIGVALVMQA